MTNSVQRTVSLQDLERLAIWSPHSLSSVAKLGHDADPGTFLVALIFAGDFYEDWDTTSDVIFVAKGPLGSGLVEGIGLEFDNGVWAAWPALHDPNQTITWYSLENVPTWIEVLDTLVRGVFRPLLHFMNASNAKVANAVIREAETRQSYFLSGGPLAFFDQALDAVAWLIASRWDHWEMRKTPTNDRIQLLYDEYGVRVSLDEFAALEPISWKAMKADTKREFRNKIGTSLATWEFLKPVESKDRMEVWAHQDQFWSLGGSPDMSLPTSSQIVKRFPRSSAQAEEAALQSQLWWWRTVEFESWSDDLKALFFDNWERSALFYEFRAREHRDERGAPFGKLWCHLTNSQRGVLAALWPPKGVGRAKFRREVPGPVAKFIVSETVNDFDQKLSTNDLPREIELRLGIKSRPSEDGKRNKAPKRVLGEKWRALEYMDKAHFAKVRLLREEQTAITKLRTNYRQACAVAGIEP